MQRWGEGSTTAISSLFATKVATAAAASARYYGVLFDFGATNTIEGGRGTTSAGGRDGVGGGGTTAWGLMAVRVVVDGGAP